MKKKYYTMEPYVMPRQLYSAWLLYMQLSLAYCSCLWTHTIISNHWIAGLDCGLDYWTGLWTELLDWIVDWITGLDCGLDYWTGLWTGLMDWIVDWIVDWIDGLDYWINMWTCLYHLTSADQKSGLV